MLRLVECRGSRSCVSRVERSHTVMRFDASQSLSGHLSERAIPDVTTGICIKCMNTLPGSWRSMDIVSKETVCKAIELYVDCTRCLW